jgi:hypothetical protein
MSKVICESCDEVFDVCAGVISLPFICGSCEKDAELAIDREYLPCLRALDSVQAEQYIDPYAVGETDPRVHAMHAGDIRDQFDADTEVINDLKSQLDEAHAANASLTNEIDFCAERVRAYQMLAAEVDKYAANQEREALRLKEHNIDAWEQVYKTRSERDDYRARFLKERARTWFEKLFGLVY